MGSAERTGQRASLLRMRAPSDSAAAGHDLPSLSPMASRKNLLLYSGSSRSGSPSHGGGGRSSPSTAAEDDFAAPRAPLLRVDDDDNDDDDDARRLVEEARSREARAVEENNKVLAMLLHDEALANGATPGGPVELLGPLDDTLFFAVCSFLTPRELCNAGAVSYLWAVLCEDNLLWGRFLPAREKAGLAEAGRSYARARFMELARAMWQRGEPEEFVWHFTDEVDGYHLLPLYHPGRRFPLPLADLRDRFAELNEAVLTGAAPRQAVARRFCSFAPCLIPFWGPFVLGRQALVRRRVQQLASSRPADDLAAGIVSWRVRGSLLDSCASVRVRYHPVDARVEYALAEGFDPPARTPTGGRRVTM